MIRVRIVGPDFAGYPIVTLAAGGKYAPDVADDLRNRAVETYERLFGDLTNADLTTDVDGGDAGEIPEANDQPILEEGDTV